MLYQLYARISRLLGFQVRRKVDSAQSDWGHFHPRYLGQPVFCPVFDDGVSAVEAYIHGTIVAIYVEDRGRNYTPVFLDVRLIDGRVIKGIEDYFVYTEQEVGQYGLFPLIRSVSPEDKKKRVFDMENS